MSNATLTEYLGRNTHELGYKQIAEEIRIKDYKNKETLGKIKGLSFSVGGLGILGGIFAPGVIGTTPALATALPAFMTSVVSVGGVSIASSLIAVSGAGLGVAALGLGAYQLKKFLDKRKSAKAQKALLDRKADELF